jgi:hypothetical protein
LPTSKSTANHSSRGRSLPVSPTRRRRREWR